MKVISGTFNFGNVNENNIGCYIYKLFQVQCSEEKKCSATDKILIPILWMLVHRSIKTDPIWILLHCPLHNICVYCIW